MSEPASPLVGIVVTARKEVADNRRTLEAPATLTYQHLEIIVVDNASQDGRSDTGGGAVRLCGQYRE